MVRSIARAHDDVALSRQQDRLWITSALTRAVAKVWKKGGTLEMARAFGASVVRSWWSEISDADHLRPFLVDFETTELPPEIEDLAAELGRVVSRARTVG